MNSIKAQLFALYLALNMLLCSLIPGAKPRETISGLMGRWYETGNKAQREIAALMTILIDCIYTWEPDHCAEVAKVEREARAVLYGKSKPEG